MNTTKAIEFLRHHIRDAYYSDSINRVKYYDIRKLLLRGRKFEKMWSELKYDLVCNVGWCEAKFIYELEQKYFSK